MKIEVIPAMDIINGECVRLKMGDYKEVTRYGTDPLEMAQMFERMGFSRIHIVDLEGAKENSPRNLDVVKRIASNTGLKIQFGGGLKSSDSVMRAFECGVTDIICGSIAVTNRPLFESFIGTYGANKVILGVDVNEEKVYINGWKNKSDNNLYTFIDTYRLMGVTKIICTDISKDGMLSGPNFDLYNNLKSRFKGVSVTASGGVSGICDIQELSRRGIDSVVVGKAIYENKIDLEELVLWLQKG